MVEQKQSTQTDASADENRKLHFLRLLVVLLVALAIVWFVVEVFLPQPFPHLAY